MLNIYSLLIANVIWWL